MATVGVYGDKLVFTVSSQTISTLRDLTRNVSGRYGSHEVIEDKPRLEFLGPDLQTVSFTMDFYMGLGVDPREMLNTIQDLVESGYHDRLVIGNQQIGSNTWTITKASEDWKYITNRGELLYATVNVSMQEYR